MCLHLTYVQNNSKRWLSCYRQRIEELTKCYADFKYWYKNHVVILKRGVPYPRGHDALIPKANKLIPTIDKTII